MSAPRTPKAPQIPMGQGELPSKTPSTLKKKRVPTNGDTHGIEKSASKASPKPPSQQDDMPSPGSPIRKKKRVPKPAADVAPPTPQTSDDAKEVEPEVTAPKKIMKKKPAPPPSEPKSEAIEVDNVPGPDQATTNSSHRDSKFNDTPAPALAPKKPVLKKTKKPTSAPEPEPEPEPEMVSESEHDDYELDGVDDKNSMEQNDDSSDRDDDQSEGQSDEEEDHDRDDGVSGDSPLVTDADAGGDSPKQSQETASGLPDHAQKRVDRASKDANVAADSIRETANTATPHAISTAGRAIGTAKGPAPDLRKSGAGHALGGAKHPVGGVRETAGKAAGDVQDEAASTVGHAQDTAPVTEDMNKTIDNGTTKPTKLATGATEKLGGLTNGAADTVENANKQGEDHAGGVAKQMANTAENSKSDPGHDDSEKRADETGKPHENATGDLKFKAGSPVNDTGEIVDDFGMAIRKVNGVARETGDEVSKTETNHDEHQVSGKAESANVSVSGIEIKVETNPNGTTLTIKIPGGFQQQ